MSENGLWTMLPETVRRWAAGILVGIAIGGGASTAISQAWPEPSAASIAEAFNATMQVVTDRIVRLESRSETNEKILHERGRVIDTNTIRIAALETRLDNDIREIKTLMLRLEDKLERVRP